MDQDKSVGVGVGLKLRVNGKALLRGEHSTLNAKHGQGVVYLCRRHGREEVSALHKAQQLVDLQKFGLYSGPL
jgi:phosphohistidine swiveling domain-containing protein